MSKFSTAFNTNKLFRKTSIILGLIILIGGSYLAKKMGDREVEKPPTAIPTKKNPTVQTLLVAPTDHQFQLSVNGQLTAKKRIELFSEVSGVLQNSSSNFREGVAFRSGETLLAIDDSEAKLALQARRSQLQAAIIAFLDDLDDAAEHFNLKAQKSRLKENITTVLFEIETDFPEEIQAWKNYVNQFNVEQDLRPLPSSQNERFNFLLEARGVKNLFLSTKSQEATLNKYDKYDSGSTQLDLQKWNVYLQSFNPNATTPPLPTATTGKERFYLAARGIENQYLSIKSDENRLQKYRITAPFSGIVTQANVTAGTLVRTGQKMGEFINDKQFEMKANVALSELNFLQKGDKVQLTSDLIAGSWTGKVERIGRALDAGTQTQNIYISVQGDNLSEGLFLAGKIAGNLVQSTVQIDRKNLIEKQKVYTVSSEDKLQLTRVELLGFEGNKAIISGLSAGTRLLDQQLVGAFDGMEVNTTK